MGKTIRAATWGLTGLFALLFMTQPVSANAQLALSTTVIVCMLAVWTFGRGLYARWAFLALGSLVVVRYIFWRATSTLPPLDQPINFTLGVLLVLAELYCVLILIISLIINADPLNRKPLERSSDDELPTVDVFIPSYNEDEAMLAQTIAAAKSMDYPADKLTVWLLDDGGTEQKVNDKNPEKAAAAMARRLTLQKTCADLGARYLTRAKNEHAKAGNMNNGLKQATGKIIVVFDADHAPFRSFLRETVGYFAQDPKLFLVQTPHVFLNPDPIERNLRTFKVMPSENEMFYSVTQRGLDKWNGSFFCGSAALLRREALDVAGGFSGITITEDCETAFELHGKGWNSIYVDKPLIAGLQPETFESFIGQRSRWCQGMFQILMLKNPLFKRGLKPIQKLAYLSSMTFWFFPLPRMVFTFAPLLHIFFDVKIFVSSMDEALAYTATYIVVNLFLQNYLYGKVRWPFVSELYEYVQGVYLAKAIFAVILRPKKPTFNVTAKGVSLDQDHLSGLALPFFVIFAMLFIGVVTAFYRYFFEPGANLMLIVGLWASFNLMIAGVALGVVAERREPDRHPRLAIDRRGRLAVGRHERGDEEREVSIHSVSAGGCALRFLGEDAAPEIGETASVTLTVSPLDGAPARGPMQIELRRVTREEDTTVYGFSFADMTPASYMALADLMYGDPDAMLRFVSKRRNHKNLLVGSGRFFAWGVAEPVRAFRYLIQSFGHAEAKPAEAAPAEVAATVVAAAAVTTVEAEVASAANLAIEASDAAVLADVSDLAPLAEEDFDALAASLVDPPPDERAGEEALAGAAVADWMSAVLALASDELKRVAENQERSGARSSVAA